MNILLDTQALILAGRDELPFASQQAFLSQKNSIYFSLVSLWEIGIKHSIGNLNFNKKLSDYQSSLMVEQGLILLGIDVSHIEQAVALPFYHKDPFDRLLLGQAQVEGMTLMSSDCIFDQYSCERIWA